MAIAPAPPYLERKLKRSAAAWSSEGTASIEIVSPDRYSTVLLLGYAPSLFRAEIVASPDWIVRLQPPAGTSWVAELLALVERWLESARLPCAKLLYGGRSYLIRAATEVSDTASSSIPSS